MNRTAKAAIVLTCVTLMSIKIVADIRQIKSEEEAKCKQTLDEMGVTVAAIHNATDIINAQIAAGKIRDMDALRARVLDEVAFQKIVISEQM